MKQWRHQYLSCGIGLFLLFLFKTTIAQNPQFGHFYSNAILYNPAFTGNVERGQFALSYRNQWPGIAQTYVSYAASYEYYFDKLKSGMGLQVVRDKAGSGGLTTTGINYSYSYQIPVSREIAVLVGLKAGVHSRFYDFDKFTFPDQIARDNAPESIVTDFRDRVSYANFGQGLVFYHIRKYWFGVSFDHLNKPNTSLVGGNSELPILMAIQGGYNFDINKSLSGRTKGTLTAAFLYKSQKEWDQLDLGIYYKNAPFLCGIWYRGLPIKSNDSNIPNIDAIAILTGYKFDRISFAYSYDITASKLAGNTNGSHEISISLEYPKSNKKRRRYFRAPCPKF